MPTKTIRVLQMTARSDLGGGPRHLLDLMKSLEGSEIEISVAAPLEEPFGPQFKAKAANFIELPHRKFSLSHFFRLWMRLRRGEFDLIHSHGRGAGLYSRPLGWLTGTPVVHTFHGIHQANGLVGQLKLWIDRLLARLPFYAVFVSDWEKTRGLDVGVTQSQLSSVIWNAVDLSRFSQSPKKNSSELLRVGIFLRPELVKGPDFYLKFAKSAAQDESLQNLIFTCAGVSLEELSQFGEVPPNLDIAGKLSEPATWLAQLDLYVSTSRAEGLPIGVLEAMASGVPCLISDISAHRVFIDEGCAAGYRAGEVESFLASLTTLISPDRRENLVKQARSLVESRHSLSIFAASLKKVYRSSFDAK